VAATRAKTTLHLCYNLTTNDDGEIQKPSSSSLLAKIWEQLPKPTVNSAQENTDTLEVCTDEEFTFKRLSNTWQFPLPDIFNINQLSKPISLTDNTPDLHWQDQSPRIVGTFVHRIFNILAEDGIEHWTQDKIDNSKHHWQQSLLSLGVTENALPAAINMVMTAVSNIVTCDKGRWILAAHQDPKNEYPLMINHKGKVSEYIIDRTFITTDNDERTRWIIDYKTSSPSDDNIEAFLDHEYQVYKSQLENYAHYLEK